MDVLTLPSLHHDQTLKDAFTAHVNNATLGIVWDAELRIHGQF
jgi:hypothetical protein